MLYCDAAHFYEEVERLYGRICCILFTIFISKIVICSNFEKKQRFILTLCQNSDIILIVTQCQNNDKE